MYKRIINLYSGIENGTGHFKNGHYFGTVADSSTTVTQKDFIKLSKPVFDKIKKL